MKIYQNINEIPYTANRAITVGCFDGLHLGHLQIIKHLKEKAQKKKIKTMVITFEPHPQIYFSQKTNKKISLLTTLEEKISILKLLKIDELFIINFNEKIANLEANNFIYYLETIGFSMFVIGYNHSFGKDRKGDFELLKKRNEEKKKNGEEQFNIIQVPQFTLNKIKVSSSKIRQLLLESTVENANKLLGYNYFIVGTVDRGRGIGRKLGFPTANIKFSNNEMLPQNGVYICTVEIYGNQYLGVANIGYRPTVAGQNVLLDTTSILEVHILDFVGDIYGIEIMISFVKFLREEKKFDNPNELIEQIQNDIDICVKYFE